jgi:glycosyltransferase involved in cell wall biosynthesis
MRVLMLTPTVDPSNRLNTGFAHVWVEALGRRVDRLEVICRTAGAIRFPDNITVTGVDNLHSAARFGLLPAFHAAISRSIRRVDLVFSHLAPRYALAAAPNVLRHGIPLVHWDANGKIDSHWQKWTAHLLANRIVTAVPEGYRFSGPKVTVIGHGVDFQRFVPAAKPVAGGRTIIAVGMLSPVKNYEAQIDAAALLLKKPGFEDVTFKVAGDEGWWADVHRSKLEARVAAHGLGGRFLFLGGLPYSGIQSIYQDATLALSTSKSGGLDKVVLEAMGCGLPTLATGRVYGPLLGDDRHLLLANEDDPHDLAERLARLLMMSPAEREALGFRLRQRAMAAHAIEPMMDRLVEVFRSEIDRRKRK